MMDEGISVATQPVQSVQCKVLVIDDTAAIVEFVRHALKRFGYTNVITASNGIEGLEAFYRERPDCVIVDVRMPGLDGYQVVRAIRGDLTTANTPLVILSALQEPDHRLIGLLSGVDEYLPKPFKVSELAAALERVMNITPEERTRRMKQLADDDSNG